MTQRLPVRFASHFQAAFIICNSRLKAKRGKARKGFSRGKTPEYCENFPRKAVPQIYALFRENFSIRPLHLLVFGCQITMTVSPKFACEKVTFISPLPLQQMPCEAGAQGGLISTDQANIKLPRSLGGRRKRDAAR